MGEVIISMKGSMRKTNEHVVSSNTFNAKTDENKHL